MTLKSKMSVTTSNFQVTPLRSRKSDGTQEVR